MKSALITIFSSYALVGICSGTVTLDFSAPANVFKGIANSSSTVSNGLAWGIVVDTQNNGFSEPFLSSAGLKVEDGANFGNGYFFYNPLTEDGTQVTFTSGLPLGGAGAIDFNSFNVYGDANPIAADQKFAVIWFGNIATQKGSSLPEGTFYGIATSASATLPSDTLSATYSASSFTTGRNATLQFVPEPSTALLGLLGLAGLLRRKR
jgi:hypothetical protein